MTLPGGALVPRLAFGVYQIPAGAATQAAVTEALARGYRHLDTAQVYRNEADVGAALRASGLRRDEVFLTTKLAPAHRGPDPTRRAVERSLMRLGVDRVDLFLVHFPVDDQRLETWRTLVALRDEGLICHLGVSNYTVRHLEILRAAGAPAPCVDQVESSPFCAQHELAEHCRARGIVLAAYSPLTQGVRLRHPVLVALAERLGCTPAQLLLRWAVERGIAVVKSVSPYRMEENVRVFAVTLDDDARARLAQLDENFRTCWDPTDVP